MQDQAYDEPLSHFHSAKFSSMQSGRVREQHHRLELFNIISMDMKTLLVYGDCIWFMKCMLYDNVCYAGVYIYVYVQSKGQ